MHFSELVMKYQEEEVKKKSYLYMHPKKTLRINLTEVKKPYTENYKTLMKETKSDKGKDISCS